jgi:hypothetical protein
VPLAVSVHAKVTGRRRAAADHPLRLELPAGQLPAAEFLEAVTRAEIAAYEGRAQERTFLRVLTEQVLDGELATGAVRLGGDQPAARLDEDAVRDAVAEVLLAFGDGLFKLFLDDREVGSADTAVTVRDGSQALFLRLVPLAGG